MNEIESTHFKQALVEAIDEFSIGPVTDQQIARLTQHYDLLKKWNRKLNLTRIVDPAEAARLHYAESLFAGRFIKNARNLLDIGSGAGFPAIPLAVLNGALDVTALESNRKKALFLVEAKEELGLTNLQVINVRFEEYDRSGFEVVTVRAIEKSESVAPALLKSLAPGQRLMVFCSNSLFELLRNTAAQDIIVEPHIVPGASNRLVGIFKRGKVTPIR